MTVTTEEIRGLVTDVSVHRRVYTDPEVFALEMERIFERTWVYVGHESQVKDPGDFITVRVGRQPMIMVRDRASGDIGVFYNRCTHKGALLACERAGAVRGFRCPYHGWMFGTDGSLKSTPPATTADTRGFELGDPAYNLMPAAQVDTYRGFVFANLAPGGPGLHEYFGRSLSSFDNMVDRAPEGELEVAGGVLRYRHRCNWKMFVENLNDNMHPVTTHHSATEACQAFARRLPEGAPVPDTVNILGPFGSNYEFFDGMSHRVFPHGHGYSGDKQSIHSAYPPVPDYVAAMEQAYGEDRTREILTLNRHNTLYYPSLTIKGAIQAIRVARPIGPEETEIESYTFRLKGAPPEMLRRTVLYSMLINSPGSIVGHDDFEVYERMQRGLQADGPEWVSMARQFGHDAMEEHGEMTGPGSSELPFRNQYKAWLSLMTAEAA